MTERHLLDFRRMTLITKYIITPHEDQEIQFWATKHERESQMMSNRNDPMELWLFYQSTETDEECDWDWKDFIPGISVIEQGGCRYIEGHFFALMMADAMVSGFTPIKLHMLSP